MRHGKFTKEKLKDRKTNAAAGRAIRKELCHIESQLIQRGLLEKHWQDKFFS
jgi:hypothetical protein